MNNILVINIGKESYNVFLQEGFLVNESSSPVHKHNYAEIHIVSKGKITFVSDGKTYDVTDGNAVIVPGNTYHSWICDDNQTMHCAFQSEFPANKFKICQMNTHIVREFFDEINRCEATDNYTKMSAYLTLVCTHFCDGNKVDIQPITDYGFLIHEFFCNRYNEDIKLCDLAHSLYLSERQTERLVISVTGKPFRRHLADVRISMAKLLLESTDMSMADVARYVGYKSYAGFWKAQNKQGHT